MADKGATAITVKMPSPSGPFELDVPQHLAGGVYANHVNIAHTKEEFIIDFVMATGTGATLTARVIVNPAHMKRIADAVQKNVEGYESRFGGTTEEPEEESLDSDTET